MDIQHVKTRLDVQEQDGRKTSFLVLSDGEKEVSLADTLEAWYEKYQAVSKFRDITDEMVKQCVQMVENL